MESKKGREVSLQEIEKIGQSQVGGQPGRDRNEPRKLMDGKILRLESSQELRDGSRCVQPAATV